MASAARQQITGGGAPVIKNWRRRPQIDAAGAGHCFSGAGEVFICTSPAPDKYLNKHISGAGEAFTAGESGEVFVYKE